MARFSKAIYVEVAQVIRDTRPTCRTALAFDIANTILDDVMERFVEVFLADNHEFDPEKFRENCNAIPKEEAHGTTQSV